ncbi:MAG: Hpt domain-containing protein [Dehalococcoidia bacterium]|nr:Hpt domain-containing protein [Dehalococcoidia bacterium]
MPGGDRGGIDVQALDEATGSDPEFMVELLTEYIACSQRTLEAIRAGLAAGDATAVLEGAHQLKGSSRAIGAFALGDTLQSFEQTARVGRPPASLVAKVEEAFSAVRSHAAQLISEAT